MSTNNYWQWMALMSGAVYTTAHRTARRSSGQNRQGTLSLSLDRDGIIKFIPLGSKSVCHG